MFTVSCVQIHHLEFAVFSIILYAYDFVCICSCISNIFKTKVQWTNVRWGWILRLMVWM